MRQAAIPGIPWTVGSEFCNEETSHTFKPQMGETWGMPIPVNSSGEAIIYNRGGAIIYASKIVSGQPRIWDGNDSGGQPQPTGLYILIFKSTDGAVIRKEVTLMR